MVREKPKTIRGVYYQLTKSSSSSENISFNKNDITALFDDMRDIRDRFISIRESNRFIVFPENNKYTLLEIPKIQGFVTGAFTNLRNGLPPILAEQENTNIRFSSIPLGDNQNLAEISFFIINSNGIMLFLNNTLAGNESVFSAYINSYMNNNGIEIKCNNETANILDVQSIIEKDAFERLLHFVRITGHATTLRVLEDITPEYRWNPR